MTEGVRLSRPYRRIDYGLVAIGVVCLGLGGVLQSAAVLAIAAYAILLGTSTEIVSRGLEAFTGDAIGEGGDVDEDTDWLIG